MSQTSIPAQSSRDNVRIATRIAVASSVAFLALLLLLHFLEPEFNPLWRMISEYEIGPYGWMMRLAFFCWGISALAVLVAIWPMLNTRSGRVGRWWMLVITVALFGAGIFVTNAITDTTPNTANDLHTLCGAVVILTFPIAATLVTRSLSRDQGWATTRRQLFWVTTMVWIGMVLFFASIIISRAINPSAGRVGPDVYLGWPNRLLVVIYNVWLIVVARRAAQLAR